MEVGVLSLLLLEFVVAKSQSRVFLRSNTEFQTMQKSETIDFFDKNY